MVKPSKPPAKPAKPDAEAMRLRQQLAVLHYRFVEYFGEEDARGEFMPYARRPTPAQNTTHRRIALYLAWRASGIENRSQYIIKKLGHPRGSKKFKAVEQDLDRGEKAHKADTREIMVVVDKSTGKVIARRFTEHPAPIRTRNRRRQA
jgi:hypothetical protein